MPTFLDVPCVYCNGTFTWQNDADSKRDPRVCCFECELKFSGNGVRKQCVICTEFFIERHTGALRIMMNTCFNCNFWIEYITRPHPNRVIIDHKHYVANPLTPGSSWFAGFGGRLFEIEFLDGSTKHTNDLWSQGDIPDRKSVV